MHRPTAVSNRCLQALARPLDMWDSLFDLPIGYKVRCWIHGNGSGCDAHLGSDARQNNEKVSGMRDGKEPGDLATTAQATDRLVMKECSLVVGA